MVGRKFAGDRLAHPAIGRRVGMVSVSSKLPFEGWGSLTALISRILQFGLVSGVGLVLDFVIFTLLVTAGVPTT
jgi:hypothetical protein